MTGLRVSSSGLRAALIVLATSAAVPAVAQPSGPAGSVSTLVLVRSGDIGGGVQIDLWHSMASLQVGGTFGVSILRSDQAERARAYMPVGAAIAVLLYGESAGVTLRLAGGAWGGATNDGLVAGGWIAGSGSLDYRFARHASLAFGVTLWRFFGGGDATIVSPTFGLLWHFSDDADDPEDFEEN